MPARGRHGHVLTVFAPKGGCGKTTLAANLAVVLNARGHRVCLVDLDLAFGDIGTVLGRQPGRSLADAVGKRPLDAAVAASLVTPIRPDLDAVLAPASPGAANLVPADLVAELLTVLPAAYDYVVVDAPTQFSGHVLAALDAAHHQVLLTTPERPALQKLRLTLDTLDLLGYRRECRSVVLNRCDSRVGLTAADIERTIRFEIAGELPSSRDLPASTNRCVPIAAALPEHRFSRAVTRFVELRVIPIGLLATVAPSGGDASGLRWPW